MTYAASINNMSSIIDVLKTRPDKLCAYLFTANLSSWNIVSISNHLSNVFWIAWPSRNACPITCARELSRGKMYQQLSSEINGSLEVVYEFYVKGIEKLYLVYIKMFFYLPVKMPSFLLSVDFLPTSFSTFIFMYEFFMAIACELW